jgi:peptide/nickel transport system substrate-binding protein
MVSLASVQRAAADGVRPGRRRGRSGTSGSGGAVRDGGTMTVALADDPDMLDPTLARTLVGRMVFMSMCEKLYAIDQKVNVVPQLAASPTTISQDGRSAEIKLRQGVRFNDDTPLDAARPSPSS